MLSRISFLTPKQQCQSIEVATYLTYKSIIQQKQSPWLYFIQIFADCKTFNGLVLAKLCKHSNQVLIKSCKKSSIISQRHHHQIYAYTVSQRKGATITMPITVNSWSIWNILSLLQRALNFQRNPYQITHYTLSMLLRYLGKLWNQKFCTFHAHETCFKCDFLSSIQQISVMCHENKCKD